MASKIRKFNGYHYLRATSDLDVEDSKHESFIPKDEVFLVGKLKGKYYIVDLDVDEKTAYRFLINKKTYTKFIEQSRVVQPAAPSAESMEHIKTLIKDREVTVPLDIYPEVLVYSGSNVKVRKTSRQATLKISDVAARQVTSNLKVALNDDKVSQTFDNMKYSSPKDYRNTPKEQYFKDYLDFLNAKPGVQGRYSDVEAVNSASFRDKLDSHPLAGSKELKAFLKKAKDKPSFEPKPEHKDLDDILDQGNEKAKYNSKLANYHKQIDNLKNSFIFKNATEEQLEAERRKIYEDYHPDYVKPEPKVEEPKVKTPEEILYEIFRREYASLYVTDRSIDVKSVDKSISISYKKLDAGTVMFKTLKAEMQKVVDILKNTPELKGFSPKLYMEPINASARFYYLRLFLFRK